MDEKRHPLIDVVARIEAKGWHWEVGTASALLENDGPYSAAVYFALTEDGIPDDQRFSDGETAADALATALGLAIEAEGA